MEKIKNNLGKIVAWKSIRIAHPEITIDSLTEYEKQSIVSVNREVVRFSHGGWSYTLKNDESWSREPIPHWFKLKSNHT